MSSKQREALNQILGLIDNEILVFNDGLDLSESTNAQYQLDKADEALAEPLRNCDVGTIEEQSKRFNAFCFHQRCNTCPLNAVEDGLMGECGVRWAQAPYENEVTGES